MSSSAIAVSRLDRPHGAVGTLVIVKSTFHLCARAATGPLKRNTVALLRPSVDVEVVPHLRNLCATVVQRSLAMEGLVVARTRAADVRSGAVLCAKSLFEVREGVGGAVGGDDVGVGEPLVGVQTAVVHDDRLEEVDHFFVLDVLGAVAGDVEGGEAGGVLGEFVLL